MVDDAEILRAANSNFAPLQLLVIEHGMHIRRDVAQEYGHLCAANFVLQLLFKRNSSSRENFQAQFSATICGKK